MKLFKAIAATAAVITCCIGNPLPAEAVDDNNTSMLKKCYVDVAELVSMIEAYSPAQEHYHKVKGLYTWQASTKAKVDLSGSGMVEVKCD